mmetsp:Transcript_36820/g.87137  ORF Transcript_36820/g.87137 Transcript_36820/m.87137 type:complete len:348 (-) Transcript_36820:115-1158(-)
MSKADAIMDKIQEAEVAPWSEEEKQWMGIALSGLTEDQRMKFMTNPLDVLLIIRGFASENDRKGATMAAAKKLADWRDKVGFYEYFNKRLASDEDFYKNWPERIYGTDQWGHFLQAVRCSQIDTDALLNIDGDQIEVLQGQKMKAYSLYKSDLSKQTGAQRYKHTLLVDLSGMSMGMLRGQKRALLKHIFDIGSTYYPETMWKIYLVNAPMVFRAIWTIIKPWLHPLTVNKIQIVGNNKEAIAAMAKDHIPLDAIPDWMGGNNKGRSTFEYVMGVIDQTQRGLRPPGGVQARAGSIRTKSPSRRGSQDNMVRIASAVGQNPMVVNPTMVPMVPMVPMMQGMQNMNLR